MSEDARTLWVGNLDEKVSDEIIYELFLQTGPIDRVIIPAEGEGDDKKHKGHAYVVFQHAESVQYATQVLEGSSLFEKPLSMKIRSLPVTYKTAVPPAPSNQTFQPHYKPRFDNSSLRGGFNRSSTWHGRDDFVPRGRGSYRNRGGGSNFIHNNYNTGYNNYNNQGYWAGNQQQQLPSNTSNQVSAYSTTNSMQNKQQSLMQQQQAVMSMASQMFNMNQPQQQQQQPQQQQQQQQQVWTNNGYNTSANSYSTGDSSYSTSSNSYTTSSGWSMTGSGDTASYQTYDQYSTWYPQQ